MGRVPESPAHSVCTEVNTVLRCLCGTTSTYLTNAVQLLLEREVGERGRRWLVPLALGCVRRRQQWERRQAHVCLAAGRGAGRRMGRAALPFAGGALVAHGLVCARCPPQLQGQATRGAQRCRRARHRLRAQRRRRRRRRGRHRSRPFAVPGERRRRRRQAQSGLSLCCGAAGLRGCRRRVLEGGDAGFRLGARGGGAGRR